MSFQSHVNQQLCLFARYGVASIARNNLVASAQNIQGAQVVKRNLEIELAPFVSRDT